MNMYTDEKDWQRNYASAAMLNIRLARLREGVSLDSRVLAAVRTISLLSEANPEHLSEKDVEAVRKATSTVVRLVTANATPDRYAVLLNSEHPMHQHLTDEDLSLLLVHVAMGSGEQSD